MENQKTIQNISSVQALGKKIKKEHFIKLFLWGTTVSLLAAFFFILIFCVVPFSNGRIEPILQPLFEIVFNEDGTIKDFVLIQDIVPVDANSLYVFNATHAQVILLCNILGMSGWITFFWVISIYKNMITPSAIKGAVRKALQFNYLKQEQVERIVDEIDINIGIKEVVEDEVKED